MNKPHMNILQTIFIGLLFIGILSCTTRGDRREQTTENQIPTPDDKEEVLPPIPEQEVPPEKTTKLSKVIFYLENSGSMFGYVRGFSEYADVVSDLAEKPKFVEERTLREFNLINGGDDIKVTKLGNDPAVLKDRLNVTGFYYGDITKSNLNAMFQFALKRATKNTISILISDGIYDLDKPGAPMTALAIEGKTTRSRFIERLGEGGLQTLMIKMNSHFKGNYYNAQQEAILLDQDRPYYIWIFGNSALLNKYFPDQYITSLTGYRDMARFLKYENDLTAYQVVNQNSIGRFKFDRGSKNKLVDVEQDRHNATFQFTIATDFSNLPFSNSYLNTLANYECNNPNYGISEISTIGNVKIYGLNFTPTHLISVKTTNSPFGEIEVYLKNNIPHWITATNIDNEKNIVGDSTHTFGFQFLTKGISEAYDYINENTNLAKFQISINQ